MADQYSNVNCISNHGKIMICRWWYWVSLWLKENWLWRHQRLRRFEKINEKLSLPCICIAGFYSWSFNVHIQRVYLPDDPTLHLLPIMHENHKLLDGQNITNQRTWIMQTCIRYQQICSLLITLQSAGHKSDVLVKIKNIWTKTTFLITFL